MTEKDWDNLKNFKWEELALNGEPVAAKSEKILPILMYTVDNWVTWLKSEYRTPKRKVYCRVHAIALGKHKRNSFHYRSTRVGRKIKIVCMAFDGHVVGVSLYQMFITAIMFGFGGVGFYMLDNDNKNVGMRVNNPYIHIDVRPHKLGRTSIWYREKGKYVSGPNEVLDRIIQPDCLRVFPYGRE